MIPRWRREKTAKRKRSKTPKCNKSIKFKQIRSDGNVLVKKIPIKRSEHTFFENTNQVYKKDARIWGAIVCFEF